MVISLSSRAGPHAQRGAVQCIFVLCHTGRQRPKSLFYKSIATVSLTACRAQPVPGCPFEVVMQQADFNRDLFEFLRESPTPYHAVEQVAARLRDAGYQQLFESDSWTLQQGERYFVVRNGSSIIAFVNGPDAIERGVRMMGAHTDSPCLKVKPNPGLTNKGYWQLGVEVYGGALYGPWFDRDLSLAGRVSFVTSKGEVSTALVNFRKPVAIIPSLAIHLDREANSNRSINPQRELPPVLLQLGGGEQVDLRAVLSLQLKDEHPELDVSRVLDYELCFYDTQPPAL